MRRHGPRAHLLGVVAAAWGVAWGGVRQHGLASVSSVRRLPRCEKQLCSAREAARYHCLAGADLDAAASLARLHGTRCSAG